MWNLRNNKNNISILSNFVDQNKEILTNFFSIFKNKDAEIIKNFIDSFTSTKNQLVLNSTLLAETNKNIKSINISEITKSINIIESLISNEKITDPILARLNGIVQRNIKFNDRLIVNKESKLLLKNTFLSIPGIHAIIRNSKSVFFESGTTLAYVFLSILENDRIRNIRYDFGNENEEMNNKLNICTNNAIIHLITLFEDSINPNLLPGKPTNPYCATFGDINDPNNCDSLKVTEFFRSNEIEAFFTTASELDLNYGPHVSSIPNCKIKKLCADYIKENQKCSNIFLIASENINSNIEKKLQSKDCMLVFGNCEKTVDKMSKKELNDAKNGFESYLHNKNIKIIIGSPNKEICEKKAEEIVNKFNFMEGYPVYNPDDEKGGSIFVLSAKK